MTDSREMGRAKHGKRSSDWSAEHIKGCVRPTSRRREERVETNKKLKNRESCIVIVIKIV